MNLISKASLFSILLLWPLISSQSKYIKEFCFCFCMVVLIFLIICSFLVIACVHASAACPCVCVCVCVCVRACVYRLSIVDTCVKWDTLIRGSILHFPVSNTSKLFVSVLMQEIYFTLAREKMHDGIIILKI